MKHKSIISLASGLLFGITIIFYSCGKDAVKTNQNPSCTIINPQNGQEITQGTILTISVEALDPDGSVNKTDLDIDGIGVSSASESPYYFIWNTENENLGDHILRATCLDNENGTCSAEIQVEIIPEQTSNQYFTDPRDGQQYRIVDIGDQTWFAENLNYSTSSGSWVYDNNVSNAMTYGLLYDWETAQNVCPSGWHLPSVYEWTKLSDYIKNDGHPENIGTALKATGGWISGGNGSDNYGFSALPGGFRDNNGNFYHKDYYAYFWTSTYFGSNLVWTLLLHYENGVLEKAFTNKNYGCNVRCVKD